MFKRIFSWMGVFLLLAGFTFVLDFSTGCSGSAVTDNEENNNDDDDDNDDDDNDTANCTAPSSDHPWPMFHGFENHLGLSDAVGPQDDTTVNTFDASNDVGNPPNSIAIAGDGTIYLAGGGKVYSIDPDTLTENWSQSYSSAQGPALSANGATLYFGYNPTADTGAIAAIASSDGAEQWTFDAGGAVHFGPTIGTDGTIYQGSWSADDNDFFAVNDDGTLKWQVNTAEVGGESGAVVSYAPSIVNCTDVGGTGVDELVILGGGDAHDGPDGNVYAFNSEDGSLVWKYDTSQLRVGTPAIGSDGTIYAPASPTLYALDPSDGTLLWSVGEMDNETSGIITPAVGSDGTLYVPNSDGDLSAVDPDDGTVLWTYSTGSDGIPTFPVVDSEGTVYLGGGDGSIYAIKDDAEVFSHATGDGMAEAAAALVDGILYISSDDGNLYVIGP